LSGGASDRVVSSYKAERDHRRVVMVVVVPLWRSWSWQSWSWQGLGAAGRLVDGLLSGDVWSLWTNEQGSNSKRKCVWRSGVGTDEVACE
jgi:hypothetical protein